MPGRVTGLGVIVVLALQGAAGAAPRGGQDEGKPKATAADPRTREAFLKAVEGGKDDEVGVHLKADRSLANAKTDYGATALHVAAQLDHVGVVELLLSHGAEVNAADVHKNAPLHLAVSRAAAELLLKKGGDVRARNEAGRTPLHQAVASAEDEAVALLLKSGADVNAKDDEGNTPLHVTVTEPMVPSSMGNTIEILVSYKADVNTKNKNAESPLASLMRSPDEEVIKVRDEVAELLRKHGAKE